MERALGCHGGASGCGARGYDGGCKMVYRAGTAKLMGAFWSGRHGTPMLSAWENSGRVRFSSGTPYTHLLLSEPYERPRNAVELLRPTIRSLNGASCPGRSRCPLFMIDTGNETPLIGERAPMVRMAVLFDSEERCVEQVCT